MSKMIPEMKPLNKLLYLINIMLTANISTNAASSANSNPNSAVRARQIQLLSLKHPKLRMIKMWTMTILSANSLKLRAMTFTSRQSAKML